MTMRRETGKLTLADLSSKMSTLKVVGENLTEEERASFIQNLHHNLDDDVDFEFFLRVCFLTSMLLFNLFIQENTFFFLLFCLLGGLCNGGSVRNRFIKKDINFSFSGENNSLFLKLMKENCYIRFLNSFGDQTF